MKTLKKGILPAAAIALGLVLVSPAAAQEGGEVVPPENSAVNQYTEGFPTAGGEKDAHDRRGGKRTPDKVLGERNTERLEQRGSAGRAVAELTAETAPVEPTPEPDDENVVEETTAASGGKGDGGQGGRAAVQKSGIGSAQPVSLAFDPAEVDGSSGPGSVIGQVFGSSSGLGLLLPLLLLATIAWAIGYAMRQKRVVG